MKRASRMLHTMGRREQALRPWAHLTLACLLSFVVSGCERELISEPPQEERPDAQVLLRIDAGERVAQATAALRVRFSALPALPEAVTPATPEVTIEEPRRSLDYTVFGFPHEVSLPEDMLEEGAAFWVEVAALDVTGRALATARLISAQLPDRVLLPELLLSDVCLDVICGPRTYTCSDSGFCARAVRAPEGLESRPID